MHRYTDAERVIAWFRRRAQNAAHKRRRYRDLLSHGSCRCGAEVMTGRTRCLECARKNAACCLKRLHLKKALTTG
jgi:hypothetical protein